ncbi:rna-directed dna polymerase from mobile element jockey-like [Limosa lapponica baueri]|uniref:Rna-directed dna polymerase from mobile element jockey-like n=1 Tax=Limosa lapponica baueri TaxID=1758121 RepID=A0A2I0TLT1_LIMLA|nr:rna-directed dna polymerase from mobile element jockey-like [Limosa lapponica baueri]
MRAKMATRPPLPAGPRTRKGLWRPLAGTAIPCRLREPRWPPSALGLDHCYQQALRAKMSDVRHDQQIGKVPVDWRLANVTPIHKKGQHDDLGNYMLASLTLVPEKVMEQIILSAIMRHMKDNQVIGPSRHGSCLTNLTSFYDNIMH